MDIYYDLTNAYSKEVSDWPFLKAEQLLSYEVLEQLHYGLQQSYWNNVTISYEKTKFIIVERLL